MAIVLRSVGLLPGFPCRSDGGLLRHIGCVGGRWLNEDLASSEKMDGTYDLGLEGFLRPLIPSERSKTPFKKYISPTQRTGRLETEAIERMTAKKHEDGD